MKLLAGIAAVLAIVGSAAQAAGTGKPVEVMVLGTWHFDNPGLDLHNVTSDDVTAPRRQAELELLAEALATFKPTKIMVERIAKTPDLLDPKYAAFTPELLRKDRDERVQVGYRVAHLLGQKQVYAVDEQGDFPFGQVAEYAKAKGRQDQLDAIMAQAGTATKEFERQQPASSIAKLLLGYNDPVGFQSSVDGYYDLLRFGDGGSQPGAELNAMWYLRNARIWAKLASLVEPGDRVLVIYGAGHNYWLRHFAGASRGFRNVDPRPYLQRADAPSAP